MSYTLGVELGTVRTTAVTNSAGRVRPCPLGHDGFTIPSYVRRDDGRIRIGEAAVLHGGVPAVQLAREATGVPGPPGPGRVVPADAHDAMELLLASVIEQVEAHAGARACEVVLAQPATLSAAPGGPYGAMVARLARDARDAHLVAAPVAALAEVHRARRLPAGPVAAVLDLANDVAEVTLVRDPGDGFEIVGRPALVPGVVGREVDGIVLHQVDAALDGAVAALDRSVDGGSPVVRRLHDACRRAAFDLLGAHEAIVEVPLPRMPARVRLTRLDLQRLITPRVHDVVGALGRVLADAGMTPGDLEAVVLVGGQARLPVVGEVVGERLRRPVVVEAAPELTVAFGTALLGTAGDPRRATPTGVSPAVATSRSSPASPAAAPVPVDAEPAALVAAEPAGRDEDRLAARTSASRDGAGGLRTDSSRPHAALPETLGPRTQPVPVVGADTRPEGPEKAPGPAPSRTGSEELDALPWMPYTGPHPLVPITGPHPGGYEHTGADRPAARSGEHSPTGPAGAAVLAAPTLLPVPLPDDRPGVVSRWPRLHTLRRSTERPAEDEDPEGRPGSVGRPRTEGVHLGRLAEPDDSEGVNRTLALGTAGLALLVVGLCAVLAMARGGEGTGPGGARSGGRGDFWPELTDPVIVSEPGASGDDATGAATTSPPAAGAAVPEAPPTPGTSRRTADGRPGGPAGAAHNGDGGTAGTHSGGAGNPGGAPPSAGPALDRPPSPLSTDAPTSTSPAPTGPAPAPATTAPPTTLAPTTTSPPAPVPVPSPAP